MFLPPVLSTPSSQPLSAIGGSGEVALKKKEEFNENEDMARSGSWDKKKQ